MFYLYLCTSTYIHDTLSWNNYVFIFHTFGLAEHNAGKKYERFQFIRAKKYYYIIPLSIDTQNHHAYCKALSLFCDGVYFIYLFFSFYPMHMIRT